MGSQSDNRAPDGNGAPARVDIPGEDWLSTLAQSAWFAVVVADRRRIVYANPAAALLTARTAEQLVGSDPLDLLHPEDRELFAGVTASLTEPLEARVHGRRDGEWRWVAITVERFERAGRILFLSTAMDITDRRWAQERLARRLTLQNTLTEISQLFLALPPEEFERGIDFTLQSLAAVAAADRCYLFQFSDDLSTMSNTHEWCADDISSEMTTLQDIPATAFPWLTKAVKEGSALHVPLVSELPPEAAAERREFEREAIRSLVIVPFAAPGQQLGFIGLDAVRRARRWDDDVLGALRAGGAIVGSAIQRNRTLCELRTSRDRLELAQKAARGAAWAWYPDSDRLEFSEHITEIFGISHERVPRSSNELFAMIPEHDRIAITNHIRNALRNGERYSMEHRLVTPGGETIWLAVSGQPILGRDGRIVMVMGVSADITERKRTERALVEEKERAQVTLRCIADAVIRTDDRGRIDFLNPAAEELTGVFLADAVNRPLEEVYRVEEESRGEARVNPVRRCLAEGVPVTAAEASILVTSRGERRTVRDSAAPIRGADGSIIGAVLVFKDITHIRRLEREMEYLATHDPLTGLVNRREFAVVLDNAVASTADGRARHALCYLDLDNFKSVNDSCGHAAGDEMLQGLTSLMAEVVDDGDVVARLGGDEFGILMHDCDSRTALGRAGAVLNAIQAYRFAANDRQFQVGASLGISFICSPDDDPQELLGKADAACYQAKQVGRNCVRLADAAELAQQPGALDDPS